MNWQIIVALLLVAAALTYLARATWGTWFSPKPGCGSACGGCAKPEEANDGKRIALPQV